MVCFDRKTNASIFSVYNTFGYEFKNEAEYKNKKVNPVYDIYAVNQYYFIF